jgi:hypothetical protein
MRLIIVRVTFTFSFKRLSVMFLHDSELLAVWKEIAFVMNRLFYCSVQCVSQGWGKYRVSVLEYKYNTDPKVQVRVDLYLSPSTSTLHCIWVQVPGTGSECCHLVSTSSTIEILWAATYGINTGHFPINTIWHFQLLLELTCYLVTFPYPRIIFLLLFTPTKRNMSVPESTWLVLGFQVLWTSTGTWEFHSLYLYSRKCT